ncbi:MAG: hypothetical protein ACJ8J7_06800 [Sulfurifustaceae bacterium]
MLILTRKRGQSVCIRLGEIDPATPIGEVFPNGEIKVLVAAVKDGEVRLAVDVEPRLRISPPEKIPDSSLLPELD